MTLVTFSPEQDLKHKYSFYLREHKLMFSLNPPACLTTSFPTGQLAVYTPPPMRGGYSSSLQPVHPFLFFFLLCLSDYLFGGMYTSPYMLLSHCNESSAAWVQARRRSRCWVWLEKNKHTHTHIDEEEDEREFPFSSCSLAQQARSPPVFITLLVHPCLWSVRTRSLILHDTQLSGN